jgi:hypothetical protein
MFGFQKEEKKFSVVKLVLVIAGIAAAVAAAAAALMFWKKKVGADKLLEDEIDAVIEEAFAADEDEE